MPVSTPQPRLPLEPEEYPLYRPPRRIGCSGLSIVTLVLLVVFAVLFWQVTPPIIRGIKSFSPSSLLAGDSTPEATPGSGALETQTVVAEVPTVPPPTATPVRPCVKVTGTGGAGTILRAQPSSSAENVIKDGNGKVGEGAILQVIGPDVTSGKDSAGRNIVWMHVILPGDGRSGYMLGRYLQDTSCPQ